MTQQVETATVLGTITGTGNASVIVTSARMSGSPKTVSVGVTSGDTASIVGGLIRTALAFDSDVAATFLVSGSGANVVLTEHTDHANDSTLNISIANGTCTGLTAAPTSTNTTAGTGLSNAYMTLAEAKDVDRLNFSDTLHDDAIEKAINAVSREIDKICGRFFYEDTSDGTYYYTAREHDVLVVDDFVSITTLSTDDSANRSYQSWTVDTDYDLWPYNASAVGDPYQMIEVAPTSGKRFPVDVGKGVKIVGKRGYPDVPPPVHYACVLWFMRSFKRYATPLGVSASTALGQMSVNVPPPDPDVRDALDPFMKKHFA